MGQGISTPAAVVVDMSPSDRHQEWYTSRLSPIIDRYVHTKSQPGYKCTKLKTLDYRRLMFAIDGNRVTQSPNLFSKLWAELTSLTRNSEKGIDYRLLCSLLVLVSHGTIADKAALLFRLYQTKPGVQELPSLSRSQVKEVVKDCCDAWRIMAILNPGLNIVIGSKKPDDKWIDARAGDLLSTKVESESASTGGGGKSIRPASPVSSITYEAFVLGVQKCELLRPYIPFFESIPSRSYERRRMMDLESEYSELKLNGCWNVLSFRWYQLWREYTGWENRNTLKREDSDGAASGNEDVSDRAGEALPLTSRPRQGSFAYGDRPPPIDNRDIVGDGKGTLKMNMVENYDYVLLPEAQWLLLRSWYGGGPDFSRRVVGIGGDGKHLQVDLYPLFLSVYRAGPKGNAIEGLEAQCEVGRADNLMTIVRRVGAALRVPPATPVDCVRLHIKNSTNNMWYRLSPVTSPSTLDDEGLLGGEALLIEVKEKGATQWARPNIKWKSNWRSFEAGDKIDAQDKEDNWCSATVKRVGSNGASDRVEIHFDDLDDRYDTVKQSSGDDIAVYRSRSKPRERSKRRGNDGDNGGNDTSYGTSDTAGASGLNNLGNTCFMNSMLQCLSNTQPLTQYFLEDRFKADINKKNPLGTGGNLAAAYAALVKLLWTGRHSAVSPLNFKHAISKFAPQFSGFNQQDSQELLAFLLDGLHEDLNVVREKPYTESIEADGRPDDLVASLSWDQHLKRNKSIIVDLFQGQIKSTITCPNVSCNKQSVTFDPYMYLSLPLPEENELVIPVTVVRVSSPEFVASNAANYVVYNVTCPKNGTVGNLKAQLSEQCGIAPKDMEIADVYKGKVFKLLSDTKELSIIRSNDVVFAYELGKGSVRIIQAMNRQNTGSRQEFFGAPLIVSLTKTTTNRNICNMLQASAKFICKDRTNNGAFKIVAVSSVGLTCGLCDDSACTGCEFKPTDDIADFKSDGGLVFEWADSSKDFDSSGCFDRKPTVSSALNLSRLLDAFSKEETLGVDDKWYCPNCKDFVQARKKLELWKMPEILVIHIKRFLFNTRFREKLNNLVEFPIENFDTSPWVKSPSKPVFDLYGVSNHMGGLSGGHYTANCKNSSNNNWYLFNDSMVSSCKATDAISSSAYVLFYRRRSDKDSSNTKG